jgi:hypothetical protein
MPVNVVAGGVVKATARNLSAALTDPAFARSFWLLCQIPQAARGPEFGKNLARFGLSVQTEPSLTDLRAAVAIDVDRYALEHGGSGDIGEIAQMAAVEGLTATVGRNFSSYFDIQPDDVQRELARYTGSSGFSVLALQFFGILVYRFLAFYLSQVLSDHIGSPSGFKDDQAVAEFDRALNQYSRKASGSVRGITAEWYESVVVREESFSIQEARDFAALAFQKILSNIEEGLIPFDPVPPGKSLHIERRDAGE